VKWKYCVLGVLRYILTYSRVHKIGNVLDHCGRGNHLSVPLYTSGAVLFVAGYITWTQRCE